MSILNDKEFELRDKIDLKCESIKFEIYRESQRLKNKLNYTTREKINKLETFHFYQNLLKPIKTNDQQIKKQRQVN